MSVSSRPTAPPTRLAALRVVWAVLVVALIVALVSAWVAEPDDEAHAQALQALQSVHALDTRLNEEVAKSRLGIVTHYDGLVAVWDDLAALDDVLARLPDEVDAQARTRMTAQLASYRAGLRHKDALVESFKTEQAVLRSSVRAFPMAVARAREVTRDDESAQPFREALTELEHDVLLTVIAPGRGAAERARCALLGLDSRARASSSWPSEGCPRTVVPGLETHRELLGPVLVHGGVVLERQPRVEMLVSSIVEQPVRARATAMAETYVAAHARADAAARFSWLGVYALLIAVIAVGAADIIARLTGSKRALEQTHGRLSAALAELRVERDREMELAALKSRFVAMTSHEFRTPLSVVLSSAEMLEAYGDRWPREKQLSHLQRVQDAAKGMSRMLDGVLLIGRAEAGMLELSPRPLELRRLCDELVEEARQLVGSSRRLDYVNAAPEEPVWLDEKLLRHVLTNLLSNAFKYSPDDTMVTFVVGQRDDAATFDISDQGIGIPSEEHDRMFEAFHRCGNAGSVPGTGLGLAIVKRALDVHGGVISVQSELGRGTRFHVEVPYRQADP